MKQINYIILICILSMLNLYESQAQVFSYFFDFSETDTLTNMIAGSKKYEISSLALFGYVDETKTKNIQGNNPEFLDIFIEHL